MFLPPEIVSKIMLYVPPKYPFLDSIISYYKNNRPNYQIQNGILSILKFDEEGYIYEITDPQINSSTFFFNFPID